MLPEPPGTWTDALGSLGEAIDQWEAVLPAARVARPPALAQLAELAQLLSGRAAVFRDAVSAEGCELGLATPEWSSREELDAHLECLAAARHAQNGRWRERLRTLAAELVAGRVLNGRTGRPNPTLEAARVLAASEVSTLAEGDDAVRLPGPAEGPWLAWAWDAPPESLSPSLAAANALAAFLESVEPRQWQPNHPVASGAELEATGTAAAAPRPEAVHPEPAAPGPDPEPATTPAAQLAPEEAAPPEPEEVAAAPPPPSEVPALVEQFAPDAAGSPAVVVEVASVEEVAAAARGGDYLRAALLAFGRSAAGQEDSAFDPWALLVAHHAVCGSAGATWPEWCGKSDGAEAAVTDRPGAAQLVYLASQCQVTRGGADPLAAGVADALLASFNSSPPVRQWLSALQEVLGVPGLLERVRGAGSFVDPAAAYRDRRSKLVAHNARGAQLRDRAAYHHRQDQHLSRLPAVTKLMGFLGELVPNGKVRGEHPEIEAFLAQTPDEVVTGWLESASNAIELKGNQRSNLRKQAGDYLQLAAEAWHAARVAAQVAPRKSDVDGHRDRLRRELPEARRQSRGHA